ncbi:MAG: hypothetical protein QE271_03650 [Bacteriovoracaceae bacterium]|nr:hypothetical protein [Bacteriovoracaceae bacterium]
MTENDQLSFTQVYFTHNPEGVISVLTQPLNLLSTTCVVHEKHDPQVAFESKIIHELDLKLLELNYYAHGIKRCKILDSYLRPLQIRWDKGHSAILGQKSPYQNLMELIRINILNSSNFPIDQFYQLNQQNFDDEFINLVGATAKSYFYEGPTKAEEKLQKILNQKKGVLSFLQNFIKWFKNLDKEVNTFSKMFLFFILKNEFYHLQAKNYSSIEILKILFPYYYLDSELLTHDLIQDAKSLGSSYFLCNQIDFTKENGKILSINISGVTRPILGKKYIDARPTNHMFKTQFLESSKNALLAWDFHFKMNIPIQEPILWGIPNFLTPSVPWSIGAFFFANGEDIHFYYLLDSGSDFWGNEWPVNSQSESAGVSEEIKLWIKKMIGEVGEVNFENSKWVVYGIDQAHKGEVKSIINKESKIKNMKYLFKEQKNLKEENSMLRRMVSVQRQSMEDRYQ